MPSFDALVALVALVASGVLDGCLPLPSAFKFEVDDIPVHIGVPTDQVGKREFIQFGETSG